MTPANGAGARIVALLALAEEEPEVEELVPFLTDPDPAVRRMTLDLLTEHTPPGAVLALVAAFGDDEPTVRSTAIAGARELREVVVADAALAASLSRHEGSPDPEVRAAVVHLRHEHRLGTVDDFERALLDADPDVRRAGVAGLVSLDAAGRLVRHAGDREPLVRLAVARGIATIGDPAGTPALDHLCGDPDLRVRVAAVEGYAAVGCPPSSLPHVLGATDAAPWELRKASAMALQAVGVETAVPVLLVLCLDAHMDVRRAAVQSLARWADRADVRQALEAATADPDADVRGHARLALA